MCIRDRQVIISLLYYSIFLITKKIINFIYINVKLLIYILKRRNVMFNVNKEKCIGCSQCVKDCPVSAISLVDNKAEINNERCFKCGHCIACLLYTSRCV